MRIISGSKKSFIVRAPKNLPVRPTTDKLKESLFNIIQNKYEFSSSIKRGSRTGMGVMIEKAKGFWQVPPEFSGTSVDNFATRALGGIEMDIDKIVKNALESRLK